MKKICIIGSGSWGVALAIHTAKMGNQVKIWSFLEEEADLINNERKCKFLPGITIPENITCTTNIEDAVKGSDNPTCYTFKVYKRNNKKVQTICRGSTCYHLF